MGAAIPLALSGSMLIAPAASAADEKPAIVVAPGENGSVVMRVALGSDFTLSEANRAFNATVNVPEGLTPSGFEIMVDAVSTAAGPLVVTVNGSERLRRNANQDGKLALPLSADDVDPQNQVVLGFEWPKIPGDVKCKQEATPAISFTDGFAGFRGKPTVPDTISTFFGPSVRNVSLIVPADPKPEEAQAFFAAASSVAQLYGRSAAFEVSPKAPATDLSGLTRGITFKLNGQKGSVTKLTEIGGNPALEISGDAEGIRQAALGLASPAIGLASSATVKDLRGTMPKIDPLGVRTLDDLGTAQVRLVGVGEVSRNIGLSQAAFDAPISGAKIKLVASHTPVTESSLTNLNVLWNGRLVASRALSVGTDKLEMDVEIPKENIQRDNTLTLQMQASPRKAAAATVGCPPDEIPTTIEIDTTRSTIDPVGGQSLPISFDRFPQALAGTLPVALGGGASVLENTLTGAHMVHSLQILNPEQLNVTTVTPEQLLDGSNSGLLVGATNENLEKLGASLLLKPFRTIDAANLTFNGEVDDPFAAIQSVENNGREVLTIGSYRPNGEQNIGKALELRLAQEADSDPNGFFNLQGSIEVAQQGKESVSIEATRVSPQSAQGTSQETAGLPGWSIPLTLAIIAGLIVWSWLAYRRRVENEAKSSLAELESVGAPDAEDPKN